MENLNILENCMKLSYLKENKSENGNSGHKVSVLRADY
jgi:hypothetical protein